MHQAEIGARRRHDAGQLGISAERGHVVDELRAELDRTLRDRGLRRVDRDGNLTLQRVEHRLDPAELLSADTPSEPGRVDSPPTSTIAAPSSTIRRAEATASSARKLTPPSENESGVTLTTPITDGRGKREAIEAGPCM